MYGVEPERVCRIEKVAGGKFFRQSEKSVTEHEVFSRRARQYAKQTVTPSAPAKIKEAQP